MKIFLEGGKTFLFGFVSGQANIRKLMIYIGVDVGKFVLDVSVVIGNSNFQGYLGSVDNNISGFKQIENIILELVSLGVDENHIFFACENTGIYTHDCMDYFDSRLRNTYILKSSITFQARKYYAKTDFKTDLLDSAIVALTLNDLNEKKKLESINNPYDKNKVGLGFVRRSFGKEMSSLRHIFRMIAGLRSKKSELVTSIGGLQHRIFPELSSIFDYRSITKRNIINLFSREEILELDFDNFIKYYKKIFGNKSLPGKSRGKIKDFFDLVQERGQKNMKNYLDSLVQEDHNQYILENIKIKSQEYDFVIRQMNILKQSAQKILDKLVENGFFIPSFKGICDIEMGIFLGELGNEIYEMSSTKLLGFIGRHPNVYESGGGAPVKAPRFSTKKSIIKKYLYVWMGGFRTQNPSFRLYRELLLEYYGVNTEKSIINSKLKKKINCKSGEKLLKIILTSFKNKCLYDGNKFILDTILPLVDRMKKKGISDKSIASIIKITYGSRPIPSLLKNI